MEKVIENFLQYVKIDTESAEGSVSTPSTQKQHDLAKVLAGQLETMGAEEVVYDRERCYVYASIPASEGCAGAPVLGFIAHMDTSPNKYSAIAMISATPALSSAPRRVVPSVTISRFPV